MASWAASAADDDAGAPSFADDDDAIGAIDRDRIENIEWIRVFVGAAWCSIPYSPLNSAMAAYEAFTPDFTPPQTHIVFILVFTHIDTIDYGLYNAQQTSDMLALSLNTVSRPVLTASAFTGSRVQTNTPMAAARGPQRLEVVGT